MKRGNATTRKQTKQAYGWLFEQVRQILTRFDPINIADEHVNPDEYEPEVTTILPRLREAESVSDVKRIVHQEFVSWFSAGDAGPLDGYQEAARQIWGAWLRFRAVQLSRAILRGDVPPYEGARTIWVEVANLGMDDEELWDSVATFINDATDWEDGIVASPEELEESIRNEARNVIRRWDPGPTDKEIDSEEPAIIRLSRDNSPWMDRLRRYKVFLDDRHLG